MGATLLLERGYPTQIAAQIKAINNPVNEHAGRHNLGARDGSKDAELTGLEPLFSDGETEATSIEDFKWRLGESFKSSSRSNYSGKTKFQVSHLPEDFIFPHSQLDPESVIELMHEIEEQERAEGPDDTTEPPARTEVTEKTMRRKKLLRRVAQQPQQEPEAPEYPVMPYLPATCFAGNNLEPVGPRNLRGENCKKDERASGIRSQELFLATRCCGGKKNPNFRRHRLMVIRNKKRGLAT